MTTTHEKTFPRLSLRLRAGVAAGALFTGAGVVAAVLGAFFQVSVDPWLAPSQEVLDAAAGCDALDSRGQREACMRTVLAARRRGPEAATQFALAPRGSHGGEAQAAAASER